MTKNKQDPLIFIIEQALGYDQFISSRAVFGFVNDLEKVQARIDDLITQGDAKRAVGLYELFMAGCIEKIDAIDCECEMGDFFEDLFCSWVHARQEAGLDPQETVHQMFKMMDHDDYGLCYEIEKDVVKVLGKKEFVTFKEEIYSRFEKALSLTKTDGKKHNDFSWGVRKNAEILKAIFEVKKNVKEYLKLCERIGITLKDCEVIAIIYKGKRKWSKALEFVEQGLSLEKENDWPNRSSYGLSELKRELLSKLGNKKEVLQVAWEDFRYAPSKYSYEDLMKYVPKKDKKLWHDKSIVEAKKESLDDFIDICVMTKEWDILAEHILSVSHEELEDISHYTTEEAAKKLLKNYEVAAAKIYRALGLRILKSKSSKKSQYYPSALNHFEEAKKLYQKTDLNKEWQLIIDDVRRNHSRKSSFIGNFEDIVKGISREEPSFLQRAQDRWKKQMV
ncbi:MAG: hypothetical protein K8S27_10470 [Candidatus Omnitrophica bacterium]|nr:hypothetical protein [Candidatus Omnitrophota bacterium]